MKNRDIVCFSLNLLKIFLIIFIFAIISCKADNDEKNSASKKTGAKTAEVDSDKRSVKKMNLVRKPVVAGAFYPADQKQIRQMISEFMASAKVPEEKGALIGLVVPHAGYIYSGGVAAYAYKAIKNPGEIETVILLGPSHRIPFRGISVFPGGKYQTPLGDLEVDEEAAAELISADENISYIEKAHAYEHSLEVQLPFIQTVFKNVKIVTAIFGYPDVEVEDRFVDKVVEIAKKKKVLIVASSDFSHYRDYDTTKRMDSSGIESIIKMSREDLAKKSEKKESELCGINGVLALIKIMNRLGADKATELHYANSGDVTGDKAQVVGYAAIAFYRTADSEGSVEAPPDQDDGSLDSGEKKKLLNIARDTVNEYVRNKKRLELKNIKDPKLLVKNGAFVTIKERGQLRGCIGNFTSDTPLYETIIEMAISAASRDPRFPPVTSGELDQLEFEISVLSPLRKIEDVNEIKVGKHGIYIIHGFFRGVLLPQVATEYGWDRTTFLEQTCRKAGLPKDAWKDGADIYIFSAQVFSYEDL